MESDKNDERMRILDGHPLLRDDLYTKKVFETGVAANGKVIEDLALFAKMREAFLQSERAKKDLERLREGSPDLYDIAVVHSERPDLEIKSEIM